MEKVLGKIEKVFFGKRDGEIGIFFTIAADGIGVVDCVAAYSPSETKIGKFTKWSEKDRNADMVTVLRYIDTLLHQAKVSDVNHLVNTPVEMSYEKMTLVSWRILTEVL